MSQHSSESWTTQEDCDKTKVLIRSLLPPLPLQVKVNPEWALICNLSKTFGDLIKPRSENNEDEYQKSHPIKGKNLFFCLCRRHLIETGDVRRIDSLSIIIIIAVVETCAL